MKRDSATIAVFMVALFLIGIGIAHYANRRASPVAALVPAEAPIILLFDPTLAQQPVSQSLVSSLSRIPGISAAPPLPRFDAWVAYVFVPEHEWIILSSKQNTAFTSDKRKEERLREVWVYAPPEGADLIKEISKDPARALSQNSGWLGIDASYLSLPPERIEAQLSSRGTALVASLVTIPENLLQDATIATFIPPPGGVILPLTAPLASESDSLFAAVIAEAGAHPGGFMVWSEEGDAGIGWPLPSGETRTAEAVMSRVANTLARRFPTESVRTLPDGTNASIFVADTGRFPLTITSKTATLTAGDTSVSLTRVTRSDTNWFIAGNKTEFVEKIYEALHASSSCQLPATMRLGFAFGSSLFGVVDESGRRIIVCER